MYEVAIVYLTQLFTLIPIFIPLVLVFNIISDLLYRNN